ncbi:magnesium transporter CorA family protein [Roseburia sp. 831b]|uniref:magnesium transporter CorA family protein n=1 Tax=Roseburia sp. 831b TaxID=1261635 RepID=UPI0009521E40|nr:CorA family divalent cation transporter [Roseburia sp. 831b]WVK73047.1 CorA family divalent cation transporter [Roseburia sp. 831b]
MQKVLKKEQVEEYLAFLDPKIVEYIKEDQTETFEDHMDYDLLAFDWYDIEQVQMRSSQIMIYMDKENLFFLCEEERALEKVKSLMPENQDNEQVLYLFFAGLLRNDINHLAEIEDEITETEDEALVGSRRVYLGKIVRYRKELLRLKRYYEQVDSVLDNLTANINGLLSKECIRRLTILANRTERFRSSVLNLRDYVTQMREAYQAQIDIEQNNLMRIFTVITAVFLPLTLMVGWYGMNFKYMPELSWKYSYLVFVIISVAVCVILLIIFKKKKWF